MNLSSDLLSQFVKVTQGPKKTKNESTVYGTAVKQNGVTYVKIDGSELLTPVTSAADTADGERVIVMLKNHTATITGNITAPSARVVDIETAVDAAAEAKQTAAEAKKTMADLFDLVYPIGSIYMSVNSVSPAVLFGGTWEQIRDRFLLAAGNIYSGGSTGGEAEHTLTVEEMPVELVSGATTADGVEVLAKTETAAQPHNNMPPYLAVYIWKRVEDVTTTEE